MKLLVKTLIFFAIAGISAELSAQSPSLGDWYSRGIVRQQTVDLMVARQKRQDYDSYLARIGRLKILGQHGRFTSANSAKSAPSSSSANASSQATIFQPVGPPFVPQQLAARLGNTPQDQKYIEELLTRCLSFYTDTARQKGVPLYDVARALNYFIATNYFVYTQGAGPTQEQMDATRNMIRANMVQDESFQRLSDREKQQSYETLIAIAGFVDLGYGRAKQSGNENLAAQFREMAKGNLETVLGASIQRIHFTSEGQLSTED
jgi:hypothetical protein